MTLEPGVTFTGNEDCFQGIIEVIEVNEEKNILLVNLTKNNGTSISNWTEEWNLEHTLNGLSIGEYKFTVISKNDNPRKMISCQHVKSSSRAIINGIEHWQCMKCKIWFISK